MFHLRRAVLRIASSPSSSYLLSASPRTFATFRISTLRPSLTPNLLKYQRRWASNETEPQSGEDAVPLRAEPVFGETASAEQSERLMESARTNEPAEADGFSGTAGETGATDSATPTVRELSSIEVPVNRSGIETPPNNVLYVGNLFFDVTDADLRREFSRFGEVLHTRIISDNRGLSKGFGYVTFNTVDEATMALQNLNQQLFEGRRMAVQYRRETRGAVAASTRGSNADPRSPGTPSRTLFVGNMSFEMTDQDLNELFRDARNVIDVRVAIDRRTGQPRGFAHADFIDVASAEEAKRLLENKTVYGRRLRVDFSLSSRDKGRSEESLRDGRQDPQMG